MKRFFYSLLLLGGLLGGLSLITNSCGHHPGDSASGTSSVSSGVEGAADVEISNFELRAVTKSASRSYRFSVMGDTAYLTLSATIQWPEQIGKCTIRVFQDSIVSTAFPRDDAGGRIDPSIAKFVCDVDIMGDSVRFEPVETIPEEAAGERAYDISVSGKLLEVTEDFVTYQVTNYSYTGGAHPNTFTFPFTYSLSHKKVATFDNVFKPGCDEALEPIVREALARQYNVPAQHLTAAGFFSDTISLSHNIFILNGAMVFHYNAYDIAPYFMGAVNVEVYPYEIEAYLTSFGASLFD